MIEAAPDCAMEFAGQSLQRLVFRASTYCVGLQPTHVPRIGSLAILEGHEQFSRLVAPSLGVLCMGGHAAQLSTPMP